LRYDIIEKIGEGNRGEVYKARLEDGTIAAVKWAKNYEIDKEWEILTYLDGFYAPKPIFRGKRFFIMEYIDGKPIKEYVGTDEYYNVLKNALKAAYELDLKGVFHRQLGRFYHIFNTPKGIKFIDFERASLTDKSRNFLQIIGYYLIRDDKFDKRKLENIINIYKKDPKTAVTEMEKLIDESVNKKI
jgi:putative serine/threonine protein kinase